MWRAGCLLAALAALSSCATPVAPLSLPPAASRTSPYPLEAALYGAADAFAAPRRLEGRPAAAALAVAQLEFLAVEIPAGRHFRPLGSLVGPALQAARHDVRDYLGIPQEAAPQAVIDALAAAATVPGGDPAAPAQLPAALFPQGGAEVWRRLSALPRLPQANAATQMAVRQWEFGPPQELIDVGGLWRAGPG